MRRDDIIVYMDMDLTTVDTDAGIVNRYNEEFHENLTSAGGWGHPNFTKCSEEWVTNVYRTPQFFKYLYPLPGAIDTMRMIHENARLIIATQAFASAAPGKYWWLEKYAPFVENVIMLTTMGQTFISPNKSVLAEPPETRAFLMDDSPVSMSQFKGTKICFGDYTHNMGYVGIHLFNHNDVQRFFTNIFQEEE